MKNNLTLILVLITSGCAYVGPTKARTITTTVTQSGATIVEDRRTQTGRISAWGDARQVVDKVRASNGKTHSLGISGAEQETSGTNIAPIVTSAGGLIGEAAKVFLGKP